MSEETEVKEDVKTIVQKPGHINYRSDVGAFSGCAAKFFADTDAMNAFFAAHTNLLVTDILLSASNGLVVLYTNQLTEEEMTDFTEFSKEVNLKMEQRKKERRAAAIKQEEAQKAAEVELKRVLEVGRKCEEHHSPLLERMKKLEQEVKQLRKETK